MNMNRFTQRSIDAISYAQQVARMILASELRPGQTLRIDFSDDNLQFTAVEAGTEEEPAPA